MASTPTLALLAFSLGVPGAATDAGSIEIAAYLDTDTLEVGQMYSFVVDVLLDEGWDASKSGVPALFLQIEVPPSVRLAGPYLRTRRELAANEFVQEPFERLLEQNPAQVQFELIGEPATGEALGLNVVGYVDPGNGDAFFLRRRLSLALEGGAFGERVPATQSAWGEDRGLLQIGDRVPTFDLPSPDGTRFTLDEWLGEKNIIVTTYRAYW